MCRFLYYFLLKFSSFGVETYKFLKIQFASVFLLAVVFFNAPITGLPQPPIQGNLQKEIILQKDNSAMILIPKGEFIYGIKKEDKNRILEESPIANLDSLRVAHPEKKVVLGNYYIDKYEVTNEQYLKFAEEMNHAKPRFLESPRFNKQFQPVTGIGWTDADKYCKWAGKRLPTEEEWEKAARGTDGRIWPWGNEPSSEKYNGRRQGNNAPVSVGSYKNGQSPYGVMDMAGNVYEMTSGKWQGDTMAIRGGSFLNADTLTRTMIRWAPDDQENGARWLGFRCVKSDVQISGPELWVLEDHQRRAFLHYYSPIILKQADEDKSHGKHRGHDWITNFNFDRDGNFINNGRNWKEEKFKFIDQTAHQDWQIRPTLYTALIEFMNEGEKSLILLYHVYHAMQGCIPRGCKDYDIHDWERIELRLDNIHPNGPNQGETIRYHVLSAHSKHTGRIGGHGDLHYVDNRETPQTIEGKHLLVWQAKWNGLFPQSRKGELRFVKDGLDDFYNKRAKVDVSGYELEKSFHYIFVDQDAIRTPDFFNAASITQENANSLVSGKGEYHIIRTKKTKRITYELQDLADVFPTHWVHANAPDTNRNWTGKTTSVAIEQKLMSTITGTPITVPVGIQEFLRQARNGDRKGYPQKHWFWGTYFWGKKRDWTNEAYEVRNRVWSQHDYYTHSGEIHLGPGGWLPEGWHLRENGGFDGRWTPLFPD